jgi:anhydro-N-acetylmuramic acid kinase
MIYRAIGVMSGSSLDGLDIAMVEFEEQGGKWNYAIKHTACYTYEKDMRNRLRNSTSLNASDYELLHFDYGYYIGEKLNEFIKEYHLDYRVSLIASHGHTSFHEPSHKMTAQLGHGAAIAAVTKLPVVTDLRALDIALGGQGAPIVPIGEKLLMPDHNFFLNIGGIANISSRDKDNFIAFDICPANRVLNMLANEAGCEYDDGGRLAASGKLVHSLLDQLNGLDYYERPYPKSLANQFGTEVVYPLTRQKDISVPDALKTYTDHIAIQVRKAFEMMNKSTGGKMLITGGGAFNSFLVQRISEQLLQIGVEVDVPDANVVSYKEAMIMAFIGILRWRQEANVLASVTGATRDSIGGALWAGE